MARPRHWQAQYGSQAARQAFEHQATQATAQCSHLPQMVIDVHAVPVLVRCPARLLCLSAMSAMWSSSPFVIITIIPFVVVVVVIADTSSLSHCSLSSVTRRIRNFGQ